jgi:hypothetical protein
VSIGLELIKKYWIGMVLCLIVMLGLNYFFGTVCLSVLLLGIPCPACGLTRATILMLTGHFRESFQMHPLLILVILGIIGCYFIKKILKNYILFIKLYVIICLVIFVAFYIYRMKTYYPHITPMVYHPDNCLHKIVVLIHQCKSAK